MLILQRVDGDMAAFHATCAEIAAAPPAEREARMQRLTAAANSN